MKSTSTLLPIITILVNTCLQSIHAQSPYTFTYQGRLQSSGANATGLYDLQFTLYNAQAGGAQAAFPINVSAVPISNGLFTVSLNFGAVFDGTTRWLQIGVKSNGAAGAYTLLSPRQTITSVPEAMLAHSVKAGSLTSAQLADAAVTGAKIANAQVVRSINSLTDAVAITVGEGLSLNTSGNMLQLGLSPSSCLVYSNCYWSLVGNGNITPGVNFLGTVAGETAPLEFRVNNAHAMRYEMSAGTPNIIGGFGENSVTAGVVGAIIGGGGQSGEANLVESHFGTIGGGRANTISVSSVNSIIAGGVSNAVGTQYPSASSTISGGSQNTIDGGDHNTIGGGYLNQAFTTVSFSTIGGGARNVASLLSSYGTIAGGRNNSIGYADLFGTIGGGDGNLIGGENISGGCTISGGISNAVLWYGDLCTIGGGKANATGPSCIGATIAGGEGNSIGGGQGGGYWAVIAGGLENLIESRGDYATIGGGSGNQVGWEARYSTVGGGGGNVVGMSAPRSTIAGGAGNAVGEQSSGSVIGGGDGKTIQSNSPNATIGGGSSNRIWEEAINSTIGGGTNNSVGQNYGADACAIGGGSGNSVAGNHSVIGGGHDNRAGSFADFSTVAGGTYNRIGSFSTGCTIGGGQSNSVAYLGRSDTIGGGEGNIIQGDRSIGNTISGGMNNEAHIGTWFATIGGGEQNVIANTYGVVGGGQRNLNGGNHGTIGGGESNFVYFGSRYGTIPGGYANVAAQAAFAAGTRAKALHNGAFVWGDSTDANIVSTNENSVTMRASGGYRLFSDSSATVGAHLESGSGSWTAMSDRNMKENFETVSPREVLEKVAALPVQRWNYKTQDSAVRHIGPTAQDFKAAFEVGESDTGISSVDADGVALAAIKGLNQKLEEQLAAKAAEIQELRAALRTIQAQLSAQAAR